MYFEKDYILRQIMMLGEFYKRLLRLCEDQQAEDAHLLLDELCEKELSFSLSTLSALPPSGLLQFLTDDQRFTLAEIIFMESEVQSKMGNEEAAVALRDKALPALLSASHTPETAAYRYARVKLLSETARLSVREGLQLMQFYVLASHFDDAEDALYRCLDSGVSKEHDLVAEAGLSFYKQLCGFTDTELVRGGFSREEIDEGLQAWKKRCGEA